MTLARSLRHPVAMLLAALACAAPACTATTGVVVVVDSDLAAPGALDALAIEVTGPTSSDQTATTALGPGARALPQTLAIVPRGDPSGTVTIAVRVARAGTVVASRTVQTHYVAGRVAALRIVLAGACRDVACLDGAVCGDGGACVPEAVAPDGLPDWTGSPPAACASASTGCGAAVVSLRAGANDTCAVRATGGVACWGSDGHGELGDTAPSVYQRAPVDAHGVSDAVEVAASVTHTCARRAAGTVVCWGQDHAGELGDGTMDATNDRTAPGAPVQGLLDAVELGVGMEFSCARRATGAVVCWGANALGQLGNGATSASGTPVAVANVTGAIAIAVGWDVACALDAGGAVVCWGNAANQQIGNGTSTGLVSTPVPVTGLTDATRIAVGRDTSCAIRRGGAVTCWGSDMAQQLGDGMFAPRAIPGATVAGVVDAVALAVNSGTACAVRTGGSVVCWGGNDHHQLGRVTEGTSDGPGAVDGLTDATTVSLGVNHGCALRVGGGVVCWGWGQEVGNGTMMGDLPQATAVTGLP